MTFGGLGTTAVRRFRSRYDGLQMRRHRWACRTCGNVYTTKPNKGCACGQKRVEYFASKAEFERFAALALLERCGAISGLRLHPRYELSVNGVKVCTYTPDFEYTDRDGQLVIEDVKGALGTEVAELRIKLFEAIHGKKVSIRR